MEWWELSLQTCDEGTYTLYSIIQNACKSLQLDFHVSDRDVTEATETLKREIYEGRWNRSAMDYNNLNLCCGYLKRYALCHAALAMKVTSQLLEKPEIGLPSLITRQKSLKIISTGGGPGNDLIGFCYAIRQHFCNLENLELVVMDLKSGWKSVFEKIVSVAQDLDDVSVFKDVPRVSRNFVQADLTSLYSIVDIIATADIVLMVKVLSNVPRSQKSVILKNIFRSMKCDAIFIYIDINVHIVNNSKGVLMKTLYFTEKNQRFNLRTYTPGLNDCGYEIAVLQKL